MASAYNVNDAKRDEVAACKSLLKILNHQKCDLYERTIFEYKQILYNYLKQIYPKEVIIYLNNEFLEESCRAIMTRDYSHYTCSNVTDEIFKCCKLLIQIAISLLRVQYASQQTLGIRIICLCINKDLSFFIYCGHDYSQRKSMVTNIAENDETEKLNKWKAIIPKLEPYCYIDYLLGNTWKYGMIKHVIRLNEYYITFQIQPIMNEINDSSSEYSLDAITLYPHIIDDIAQPLTKFVTQQYKNNQLIRCDPSEIYAINRAEFYHESYYLVHILNEFGKYKGFEQVLAILTEYRSSFIPLIDLATMIYFLSQITDYFEKAFADTFIPKLKKSLIYLMESLSEIHLKQLTDECKSRLFVSARNLMTDISVNRYLKIERELLLNLAVNKLKSGCISTKINGAQYISNLFDQYKWYQMNIDFVNEYELRDWIDDNNIIYLMFGVENQCLNERLNKLIHGYIRNNLNDGYNLPPLDIMNMIQFWYKDYIIIPNIKLTKCGVDICRFLFVTTNLKLQYKHIQMVWDVVKRITDIDTEFGFIENILYHLRFKINLKQTMFLLTKIEEIVPSQFNRNHLKMMGIISRCLNKEFTINDAVLVVDKCLNIFWNVVHYNNDIKCIDDKMIECIIIQIKRIVKYNKECRLKMINKCMETFQLEDSKELLIFIFKLYPRRGHNTMFDVIQMLIHQKPTGFAHFITNFINK